MEANRTEINPQPNNDNMTLLAPKILGRYIVADPRICHGKLTFRGTRIMVKDVLDDVAQGLVWEAIIDRWGSKITKQAIREAVELANEAFFKHQDEFVLEEVLA